MSAFRRLGHSELLPRYIFVETLFVRRRVLEVGAVASTGGESARFLIDRGARAVVACDDDLAAVEAAQKRFGSDALRFRANVLEDLEPASFDLVIVADFAKWVRAPALLGELARRVARGGYLVGALRNPAGLALSQVMEPDEPDAPPTYGQLLDALSPHFSSIEVATQSPVLGYQLAFDHVEGLQIDGTLARQGEAAWFVVFAGAEPVRQFEPTWVQLPHEPLAYTSGKLDEANQRTRAWEERSHKSREALQRAKAELASKEAQLSGLTAALEEKRDEFARLAAQLETVRAGSGQARERDELAVRVRRLEGELELARERVGNADRRIAEHAAQLEGVATARKDAIERGMAAQEELRLERARREEQKALFEDARARAEAIQAELRSAVDTSAAVRIDQDRARRAAAEAEERVRALETELG
ncbi:MAG: methyltransferase domain-containing protein, partial [Myxococcaceae bacterium]